MAGALSDENQRTGDFFRETFRNISVFASPGAWNGLSMSPTYQFFKKLHKIHHQSMLETVSHTPNHAKMILEKFQRFCYGKHGSVTNFRNHCMYYSPATQRRTQLPRNVS